MNDEDPWPEPPEVELPEPSTKYVPPARRPRVAPKTKPVKEKTPK